VIIKTVTVYFSLGYNYNILHTRLHITAMEKAKTTMDDLITIFRMEYDDDVVDREKLEITVFETSCHLTSRSYACVFDCSSESIRVFN